MDIFLVRRLENQQITKNNRHSNKKSVSISDKQSINNYLPHQQTEENSIPFFQSLVKDKTITGKGILYDTALLIGILLLILHIYLCYKLYSIDQSLSSPDASCLNQCQRS